MRLVRFAFYDLTSHNRTEGYERGGLRADLQIMRIPRCALLLQIALCAASSFPRRGKRERERERERFVSMYRPSSYLPDLMSVASEGLALNGDHVCSLLSASIRSVLPARRTETILAQLYASTDVIAPSGKLFGFVHCISDHSQNFPRYRSPFLCFLSLRYMETRLQLLLLFYRSCKV